MPFPLGFQGRYIHYNPATRVRAFSDRYDEHITRDTEVFHRARQREGVRRNDADIRSHVDEALLVESLGIDDSGIDISKDLEFRCAAHVIAVARGAVGD